MSKKSKKNSPAGIYALCITIGIVLGIGLTPLGGNLITMLLFGAAAGALVAYLFIRTSRKPAARKHSH